MRVAPAPAMVLNLLIIVLLANRLPTNNFSKVTRLFDAAGCQIPGRS